MPIADADSESSTWNWEYFTTFLRTIGMESQTLGCSSDQLHPALVAGQPIARPTGEHSLLVELLMRDIITLANEDGEPNELRHFAKLSEGVLWVLLICWVTSKSSRSTLLYADETHVHSILLYTVDYYVVDDNGDPVSRLGDTMLNQSKGADGEARWA
jgi:hypothetical protein